MGPCGKDLEHVWAVSATFSPGVLGQSWEELHGQESPLKSQAQLRKC